MTRYELLDRIGVGGMAEIFRGKAVAAGGFEKPVAIKRILPHLSQDTRFVELLIAEAKVLSLLKHRNIVQIFDVGLGDDQQYFLVMEYVDGKDLGAIQRGLETRRKRMPFDLALHVGAEICEALEHAHSARAPDGKAMSLVHRDVSPSNVLLSRAGEIKLTDFGIAKRAEQEQTSGGAVKGKFAYISPEQARNEPVDPRSDVFSVGILLWELICNRRLFSGMSDMEALRAVRDPTKIQRPSEIDPRLTPELDALVMSALDPERARRPTAGMLGAKIRAMRYALEVTVGDPATELAKIIETAEQVERQSVQVPVVAAVAPARPRMAFDHDASEATVIRIRTADAFSMRDKDGTGMAAARQVIDRFEEEETRLAQLTSEQLQMLRSGGPRDSSDVQPLPRRPADRRPRRPT
ncbi:MAG: serine/threonine protein kinase, partial [Deltaproteobacteria bacterium]|nr:serine/threonine protein kinase [Deltaproteobacteria bacterium]